MKKTELTEQIAARIDDRYIDEATLFADEHTGAGRSSRRPHVGKKTILACAAALMLLGTTFAAAAEMREYRAATAFFTENALSADGLTRAQIKAVYRDITTRRFTCGKTAEVFRRTVRGRQIELTEPTPQQLAALWDSIRAAPPQQDELTYDCEEIWDADEKRDGRRAVIKNIWTCRRGDEVLWRVELPGFASSQLLPMPGGMIAKGDSGVFVTGEKCYSLLAFIDDSGRLIWQKRFDHGFSWESIIQIFDQEDGTWTTVGLGDGEYLCLTRLDAQGRELSFRKTDIGSAIVHAAVRLDGGYLVRLTDTSKDTADGEKAQLIVLDDEGRVTKRTGYETEDACYRFTDMIEYGGRVYLSGYTLPKPPAGRSEIDGILYKYYREGLQLSITDEELTDVMRQSCTAVLLVCRSAGEMPQTFYAVPGALGFALKTDGDGQLVWETHNILSAEFSPYTSSYIVGGRCRVYRHTFDTKGKLTGQTFTGQIVGLAQ